MRNILEQLPPQIPLQYQVRRTLVNSPFLAAATGKTPSHRPVWFMRQAGRSLPEYRQVRANIGMLEACFLPELVSEITLQPVRRHQVDAAIFFSDIMVPLKAAGIDLDIIPGKGPVVVDPIRTMDQVRALPKVLPESLGPITQAVGILLHELGEVPLIGFSGAPFTLASYLVEGSPSRDYRHTKKLMRSEPKTWHALLGVLTDIVIEFLQVQLLAGVDAVQLFDSWVGTLSLAEYRKYVLMHSERIFTQIKAAQVPRIHFGVGTGELLGSFGELDADVIGVDWRIPLDEAQQRIGPGTCLQGNLDPTVLLAPFPIIEQETKKVIQEADHAIAAGAVGHIFNLGHGVLPSTDPAKLTDLVSLVHTL